MDFSTKKYIHYEIPFMLRFTGKNNALLMKIRAKTNEGLLPIYEAVKQIIEELEYRKDKQFDLIIAHTHAQ